MTCDHDKVWAEVILRDPRPKTAGFGPERDEISSEDRAPHSPDLILRDTDSSSLSNQQPIRN